ncbi:MAG: hypothetical protein ABIU54_14980 [Candidatus Eisenbacteria bacterium]
MKRVLLAGALWCVLLMPGVSNAQVFGQFGGAVPVPMNGHLAGVYLRMSGSDLSLLGQLRLSLYPNLDFGFVGGLSRVDVGGVNRTSVKLGADFKTRVAEHTETFPLDFALGAALGIDNAEDFTVLSVGPFSQLSRSLKLRNGHTWVPYGGLGIMFARATAGGDNATDLSFPVRLGMEYHLQTGMNLVTEAQLALSDDVNDDLLFTLGVNFPF